MSHLGPATDAILDAIVSRIADVGASKFIGETAKDAMGRYGAAQAVKDGAELAVAMFNDNETLWLIDGMASRQVKSMATKALRRIAGIAEEAPCDDSSEGSDDC
jgi:hypothetical protein